MNGLPCTITCITERCREISLTPVSFLIAGSENIPFNDDSFDVIFMFKSFHHVPVELMDKALREVQRVLKPGGLVYISEPIFEGDLNEVLRLFHHEEKVRAAAYKAIEKSVDNRDLLLVDEFTFNTQVTFKGFEEFDVNVINVSHGDHQLSEELYKKVKDQFLLNMQDGKAEFLLPILIDLFQKKMGSR